MKFEELKIGQNARNLFTRMHETCTNDSFTNTVLKEQLLNYCMKISNNIAEGCERQRNNDFKKFLYIAKGNLGKIKNMLGIAQAWGDIDQNTYESLYKECDIIGIMIYRYLKKMNA